MALSYGKQTRVEEQEYDYWHNNKRINISTKEGKKYFSKLKPNEISLRNSRLNIIKPTNNPLFLSPFDSEVFLNSEDILKHSDGFFRPHKVIVIDDPIKETLYYAVNNYWSPTGTVYLFNEDGSMKETWNNDEWK